MVNFVVVLAAVVAAVRVGGLELNDEEYHSLPQLFHLDDYEKCLSSRRGVYCLGSFDLLQYRNDRLYNVLQEYSLNAYNFNHTKIHRGYCLPTTCAHIEGSSPTKRFQRCVKNLARADFGLETNLTEFQYCRTAKTQRQVDTWDLIFAFIVGVILLMNIVGTAYDVLRNQDKKPIKQLVAWSLVANWRRLTADHSDKDSRLTALKPVQAMKCLTLILVMLAHSVLAFHYTYLFNPQFFEKANNRVLSVYLQNGSSIVQSFIMISCFLLAYNLLVNAADNPKKPFGIRLFPKCFLHRICRILPLYLFILGLTTTWYAHASDGPLWGPIIGTEANTCRKKWWSQALFVSNFVDVDEKCLIHTWFLAVDMQLYVISAILTLTLARRPRIAVKVLSAILLGSIVINFVAICHWELLPMVKIMIPELMRTQFVGNRSFVWLYSAPWDSLPSALVGLIIAFIHFNQQTDGVRPVESKLIRVLYRISVPAMFVWVAGGYFMKAVTEPFWLYLYAATDRLIFTSLTAVAMYGFFNKIDLIWWKLMSWRGFEIMGRMSLSVYLTHWLFSLLLIATRTTETSASVLQVGEHWLATIFLTYWAALPLHLLVELPTSTFLESLAS
ncbi:unnamed protein product [Arctia plantaginis]|uniref:Acyltransferase 3 domain-containing protein n=1 Tax=Arctia plantaginis TaxID=874455 RepID=A0A8S1A9T8_ARCPL|nr:unnamed protein product [Arctia plantaginis]